VAPQHEHEHEETEVAHEQGQHDPEMAADHRHHTTATAIERIDRHVLIPACADEVWKVITTDGWLADKVELELTPGGDARFADPDSVRTGWVEEACPPADHGEGLLVFWWGPQGEPATRVELSLSPHDAGTWVRVAESRPLELLDLVGVPLQGQCGTSPGPLMLALA
jgi:uncharacterized protein YndB with AHSA1/START domain